MGLKTEDLIFLCFPINSVCLVIILGSRDLVCDEDKADRRFKKALGDYSRRLFIIGAQASSSGS